jgi:hypothetical protein
MKRKCQNTKRNSNEIYRPVMGCRSSVSFV